MTAAPTRRDEVDDIIDCECHAHVQTYSHARRTTRSSGAQSVVLVCGCAHVCGPAVGRRGGPRRGGPRSERQKLANMKHSQHTTPHRTLQHHVASFAYNSNLSGFRSLGVPFAFPFELRPCTLRLPPFRVRSLSVLRRGYQRKSKKNAYKTERNTNRHGSSTYNNYNFNYQVLVSPLVNRQ